MAHNDPTNRFEEALCFAVNIHSDQKRKGTDVPYIAHILSVSALVLEDGADEDVAIAALLHDSVEDQGGYPMLNQIKVKFGEKVANIVDGCTDSYQTPKLPWKDRKLYYLENLRTADEDILRVSLADKLHNARATNRGLRIHGDAIWERFNGGKDGTLWYYHELVSVFEEKMNCSPMQEEFSLVVAEIEEFATLDKENML